MKKILVLLGCVGVILLWGFWNKVPANVDEVILPHEIYDFVQKGCPHCLAAEEYLKETYPNLTVQYKDIANSQNRKLFFVCGAKFGLNKVTMGTPLICMGDKYILGWNVAEQAKFDTYVQDFLPQE